ncbi:MAG: extracellular solute-binding protein [Chloroflexi bacterium]|nr:extracellular solute-binding protein [Chloroflexota bacterium]
MRRKFSVGLVFLLTVVMLGSAVPGFAQDNELRVTWWGSQARHDRTIEVIEMYEAETGIDISYEFAGFGDYWTRLNTQAAGDELACVIQQDYRYISEWQSRDLLMPLDQFVEEGVIDVSSIDQSVLDSGSVDDELYALSLGSNSQTIIIDVDAFEEAGVELPAADWTWADFEAIALQIHEETGIWAIGPTLPEIALWQSLYLGYGKNVYNEDGTGLGYDDDQPLIDYFSMIIRLQDEGAVPTQEEAAEFIDAGPEGTPIVTGRAAMDYRWSNQVIAVAEAAGEDRNFILWTLPRPVEGNSQNFIKPSMFFSITADCDNPEEAARFINFFVNDLEANEVLLAERGVPISTVVAEHLLPLLSPIDANTFEFLAMVAEDPAPLMPPDPPGAADLRDNVYTPLFVEPVLFKLISVEEGAQMLRDEAAFVLGENE